MKEISVDNIGESYDRHYRQKNSAHKFIDAYPFLLHYGSP
jgi:hypothetical protein